MSFDANHLSTASAYAGKAVRYSFFIAGTIAFAVIAMLLIRVSNFFSGPTNLSTTASFQINTPKLKRLTATANSAKVYALLPHLYVSKT